MMMINYDDDDDCDDEYEHDGEVGIVDWGQCISTVISHGQR